MEWHWIIAPIDIREARQHVNELRHGHIRHWPIISARHWPIISARSEDASQCDRRILMVLCGWCIR